MQPRVWVGTRGGADLDNASASPVAVRFVSIFATRVLEAGRGVASGRPEQGYSGRIAIVCVYTSDAERAKS
eukprot:828515-Lingulodinium_polyedra.AAC.1